MLRNDHTKSKANPCSGLRQASHYTIFSLQRTAFAPPPSHVADVITIVCCQTLCDSLGHDSKNRLESQAVVTI